ncbi:hypothetical protein [Clostridium sp. HBUAS56010]|uniref:hypothetical protein n=1 Tax=Clostridium sp. HBUAS56010 TaxID=2571127 RepID=UPI00163D5BE3|nr:hypothetical protein [Clostridium sp. HBUAS56010]
MMIRKLTAWQEWLEAERVTSVSLFFSFTGKSLKRYKWIRQRENSLGQKRYGELFRRWNFDFQPESVLS